MKLVTKKKQWKYQMSYRRMFLISLIFRVKVSFYPVKKIKRQEYIYLSFKKNNFDGS